MTSAAKAAPANESPGAGTSHWLPVGHATQALALAGARTVTRTRSSARSSIRPVAGARGLIVVVSTTSGPVVANEGRWSATRTGWLARAVSFPAIATRSYRGAAAGGLGTKARNAPFG